MSGKGRNDFLKRLETGHIIGDGAMATLMHQSGLPARTCFEALSVKDPKLVTEAHIAYLAAGSTVIQTNTFSGNRLGLERYGLDNQVWEINRSAVKVARDAIATFAEQSNQEQEAFVFGTIGSTADIKTPDFVDKGAKMSLRFLFEEQLTALLEGGVDGVLLETFADLNELQIAVETVRRLTDLPIIANLSPEVIGVTRDGHPIDEAFAVLEGEGADVVGLNCRLGLSGILRTYESIDLNPTSHYAAVPNSGLLHLVDGDYSYTGNADYFATIGSELIQKGVNYIGGCCGTTPDHIRALVKRLDAAPLANGRVGQGMLSAGTSNRVEISEKPSAISLDNNGAPPKKSIIEKAKEEPTIIVELDPPKVLDVEQYLDATKMLKQAGVDAVTIADNSLGTVRISNIAIASLIKELGVEPLVHVACRDRNLIGQQSHLMGLHVLGIHNILLITGDPSKFGDLPGATSVYDVSSTDLTKMVKKLNNGIAFSGQPLKQNSRFVVGTSFNPHVRNFNRAIDRLRRKLEAGADYVMTQPIYDIRLFEKLARAVEEFDVPVFVGIMPMISWRNAQFLHNEVPGIQIPEEILLRMNKDSKEAAVEEGLLISQELIDEALLHFNGIYLVTPFLRSELTAHLTRYIHDVKAPVR
ncbi:bifunctional homocysteine S-methyltransferase/methylenetetrahydrofolate reductase [Aquibacillus salsiterrae]|uniref:Bifunctional homocysteine S-methyltransferase/methylenetetrahydrofolate reductase n=1 Tax=Aquibacillus salsiterrae TaxID=2950439 RepID=A0A9X4AGE4_9BACI|nr:bifunctional homocysteine S-methyltransferase/methylenetetrahydrofolate reductase [Aquibacillus salsiterrae]MDC3417008.1 bifunctional homocysteine S-methyltransferase/methylenetetrahydrofolate reductase [Aquibacillus salsiterrae]